MSSLGGPAEVAACQPSGYFSKPCLDNGEAILWATCQQRLLSRAACEAGWMPLAVAIHAFWDGARTSGAFSFFCRVGFAAFKTAGLCIAVFSYVAVLLASEIFLWSAFFVRGLYSDTFEAAYFGRGFENVLGSISFVQHCQNKAELCAVSAVHPVYRKGGVVLIF
ncbi:hypothetical protein EVAR_97804_1 [Eumeta japonica]|uniref:Uncharacterized protein n=1 Tax=Eumeta variegata TaxID=151549 RepID=A0A4C1XDZ7_EUMVA|nr:hypothetical protein EVAR_97804_1 [Eumeta japonica]